MTKNAFLTKQVFNVAVKRPFPQNPFPLAIP